MSTPHVTELGLASYFYPREQRYNLSGIRDAYNNLIDQGVPPAMIDLEELAEHYPKKKDEEQEDRPKFEMSWLSLRKKFQISGETA